jgi:putative flippase GtrA
MVVLVRSAVVGIVATLVDLLALLVLVQIAGARPEVANVPALILGLAAQFAGNKVFAFRDRSPDLLGQGSRFLLVEAGALTLNAVAFHLAVTLTPIPYPAARLLGSSLVYFGWSYPLWRRVFGAGRPSC